MKTTINRMLDDRRGTAMIEFAILAPLFIGLMLCIFEIAIVSFFLSVMQTSVEDVGRSILVGDPQRAHMTAEQFRTRVCGKLPSNMDCGRLSIDVRNSETLAGLMTQSKPDLMQSGNTTYSPGGPNTYNVVRLGYIWDVVSVPPDFDISNAGPGKRLMETTTIVKVEPYNEK